MCSYCNTDKLHAGYFQYKPQTFQLITHNMWVCMYQTAVMMDRLWMCRFHAVRGGTLCYWFCDTGVSTFLVAVKGDLSARWSMFIVTSAYQLHLSWLAPAIICLHQSHIAYAGPHPRLRKVWAVRPKTW